MSDEPEAFKQWCKVEMLGHRVLAGLVTDVTIAGAGFLRVDVPRPDGSTVTKFVSPKSIYELSPTTEEIATAQAHRLYGIDPIKPAEWSRQLPLASTDEDEALDDEDCVF